MCGPRRDLCAGAQDGPDASKDHERAYKERLQRKPKSVQSRSCSLWLRRLKTSRALSQQGPSLRSRRALDLCRTRHLRTSLLDLRTLARRGGARARCGAGGVLNEPQSPKKLWVQAFFQDESWQLYVRLSTNTTLQPHKECMKAAIPTIMEEPHMQKLARAINDGSNQRLVTVAIRFLLWVLAATPWPWRSSVTEGETRVDGVSNGATCRRTPVRTARGMEGALPRSKLDA